MSTIYLLDTVFILGLYHKNIVHIADRLGPSAESTVPNRKKRELSNLHNPILSKII